MIPVTQPLANGTQYELWLARDDGTRLAVLDTAGAFTYTRVVNNVGTFALTLPAEFDRTLIARDRRVLIWRKPVGGAMALDFVGLVRQIDTEGAIPVRTISGPCINDLLDTRIVAYAAGSAQADVSGLADTLMTNIALQNLTTSAIASRAISTYLTVAPTPAAGPSLTKAFSRRNVLDVLRELADAARIAGTPVYFGIVPTSETALEFRTRVNEWGMSRVSSVGQGLIFGAEYGNLEAPHLREDARGEANYVYGLGRGQGSHRTVQIAEDTARSRVSVFARREAAINASGETTAAGVAAAAQARLTKGRPVTSFTGTLLSVPGALYGLDWGFGDRVTIAYDGLQFDALVRAVTIAIGAGGAEQVRAIIEPLFVEALSTGDEASE